MFKQCFTPYARGVAQVQSSRALGSETMAMVAAFAVALAVSRSLPMSSTPVESPEIHYNQSHLLHVRSLVAELNEVSVLKFEVTCDLVRKFWLQRYCAAYATLLMPGEGCFTEIISGAAHYFSKDDLAFAERYKGDIIGLALSVQTSLIAHAKAEVERNTPPQYSSAIGAPSL